MKIRDLVIVGGAILAFGLLPGALNQSSLTGRVSSTSTPSKGGTTLPYRGGDSSAYVNGGYDSRTSTSYTTAAGSRITLPGTIRNQSGDGYSNLTLAETQKILYNAPKAGLNADGSIAIPTATRSASGALVFDYTK